MDITQLESLITRYQQAQPDAMQEIEPALQAERKSLAETFLNASDGDARQYFDGLSGKQFHLLRRADLQDMQRDTEGEQLASRILQKWGSGGSPGALVAAMLMLQPREFPLPEHFADITDWLRKDYADFLLTSPGVFNRIGEADQFATFFAAAIDLFHRSLLPDETFPQIEDIHNLFIQKANFIQFYFNERNLRITYRQRAEILESWALKQKARLAHVFPLRHPQAEPRKIKVGILSAHFTPQTEIYLMLSYFDKLPREICSVTLYSLRRTEHPLEEYCRSRVDNFVLLPEGAYPQQVDRIRADDLDILLLGTNTSAVTNSITIMALFRMAKIHFIVENSPVSTGFTQTDYYVSSMFNEPHDHAQDYYTEQLYRVPGMLNYYAYHFDKDPRTVNISRSQLGIPEDAVIYFSGANFFKILPDLSNAWSWIFSQVPNSYLILMPFNPNWTKHYLSVPFVNRVRAHMESAGVDFSRIRILNRVPTRADVHAVMGLCDIYMDSFPYAGACSLIDPLMVGLPIVACAGRTSRSNFASAMLRGAGLEYMIAADPGEYVEKAVALGRNSELREHTRRHIQNTLSRYNPFFDTGACGAKMAAAFTDMLDRQRCSETRLLQESPEGLKKIAEKLSARLADGNLFFRNFADTELARLLFLPYFKSLWDNTGTPHLVDIGAGHGQFAVPFLSLGWTADISETNPAYQGNLNSLVQQLPGKVRLFSNSEIPQGLNRIDMLRIGNGDSDILMNHDFDRLPPRLIMLDTGQASGFELRISTMKARGYHPVVFHYSGTQDHQLTGITFGEIRQDAESGSIIYFRQDDTIFLVTLVRALESFLPARCRAEFYPATS
ncbi:hypothetical protein QUF80_15230 [Desulfococcaceae bacterium HSG8]|nr:hypothetical protein [Desulfococcaceae bacterium HSG8]